MFTETESIEILKIPGLINNIEYQKNKINWSKNLCNNHRK